MDGRGYKLSHWMVSDDWLNDFAKFVIDLEMVIADLKAWMGSKS